MAPARKYLTLSLGTTVFALVLLQSGWLTNLNYLAYDYSLQVVQRPPSSDIVIVAIDDQSLARMGRWPWSRGLHAQLIDKLTLADSRAVALDLILAEPDRADPEGDKALAQALRRNGRVVLPVIPEQTDIDGLLHEAEPLEIFGRNAAALGHIGIELDLDGKVRRSFLKAGIGRPDRPNLAVADAPDSAPS